MAIMKRIIILMVISLVGTGTFAQTYRSNSATIRKGGFEIDRTVRSIAISDREITISNYLNGYTEPLVLQVYLVEEKEDRFDGLCRYYYCTAKNEDKLSPYQKIVVIKKPFSITLELFLSDNNKYVHDLEING
jgi:Na+-translocating ferredoxin:NAD+ oxidoreductase RnfG subunit